MTRAPSVTHKTAVSPGPVVIGLLAGMSTARQSARQGAPKTRQAPRNQMGYERRTYPPGLDAESYGGPTPGPDHTVAITFTSKAIGVGSAPTSTVVRVGWLVLKYSA